MNALRAQNFAAPSVKPTTINYSNVHEESISCRTNNIMFDSRVVRGNTYSNPVMTEDQKRNRIVFEREQVARIKYLERIKHEKNCKNNSPPPVKGRVHVCVQTEGTLQQIFGDDSGETSDKSNFPTSTVTPEEIKSSAEEILVPIAMENHSENLNKNFERMILEEAKKHAIETSVQPGYISDPST